MGASPLERALGLAHGQQIGAPGTQFLVFDHLTQEGADTLNRSLFIDLGGSQEVVVVQGYGLWRFGLMLALCYALTLYLSRELLKLQLKFSLKTDITIDRNHRLLLAVLLGIGTALLGLGNAAPVLFALAFFRVLIGSNHSFPKEPKVGAAVELLDTVRAFWLGWILPSVLTQNSVWSDTTTVDMVGLALGCTLSYLLFFFLGNAKSLYSSQEVRNSLVASFEFGCLETLVVLSVCTAGLRAGPECFAGTVSLFGCFGFARVAHAVLLRRIYTMPYCSRISTRYESLFRVAAGVWFLLPLPLGPLFAGYDQPALMIWLTVLVPLVTAGRPWGSLASEPTFSEPIVDYSVARDTVLTPGQKAALLFMSLPPELSARLFSELTPTEVQAITLEITQMPSITPDMRQAIIGEFFRIGSNPVSCYSVSDLERLAKASPEKVAADIRNFYQPDADQRREISQPHKSKTESATPSTPGVRRGKKRHICLECGEDFNHGIGLRKHQRQMQHKGSEVVDR